MSIDENENRSESDEQKAIHVTNCTLYVGRIQIVLDPYLNADDTSIAETRATEDNGGPPTNTSPKQTDLVGVRRTKPRSQRLHITTPYATRPKATKTGQTSRQQSVCQQVATSKLSCCLHGGNRCNYEARFGAGSDNYIARSDTCIPSGTDDCNAAASNGDPSRRNSCGRSPIWGTQNGGRLSPLRLVSRNKNFAKSDRPTATSRIPVSCLSQLKPPARQDRPVDLYVGSRLPVPVRPGLPAARILRIDRDGDVRPPLQDNEPSGRRCTTADRPHDTDDNLTGGRCVTADKPLDNADKPHDTNEKQNDADDRPHDTDDLAVEFREPCVDINESAVKLTFNQWYAMQSLDDTTDGSHDTDDKSHDTYDKPHDTDDRSHETDDRPHDTDDRSHDTYDKPHDTDDRPPDTEDLEVELREPCVGINEPTVKLTFKQWYAMQSLDDTTDESHNTDDRPHDTDDLAIEPREPCVGINESAGILTFKQQYAMQSLDDTTDQLQDINDGSHDTDDRPHDTDGRPPKTDDLEVELKEPCVRNNESAVRLSFDQWYAMQSLEFNNSTVGPQSMALDSDRLSDASDHLDLQLVGQNKSNVKRPSRSSPTTN